MLMRPNCSGWLKQKGTARKRIFSNWVKGVKWQIQFNLSKCKIMHGGVNFTHMFTGSELAVTGQVITESSVKMFT